MKKWLALAMAAALCAGLLVPAMAENYVPPFEEEDWAYSGEALKSGWVRQLKGDLPLAVFPIGEENRISDYSVKVSYEKGKSCVESIQVEKLGDMGYVVLSFAPGVGAEKTPLSGSFRLMKGHSNVTDLILAGIEEVSYNAGKNRMEFDLTAGYNKDIEMYQNQLMDEDGYIEYDGFDNESEFPGQGVFLAPVLDFGKFGDVTPGAPEPQNLWISFAGTDVSFQVRLVDQAPVNMLYNDRSHPDIVDIYPDNEMYFMNFKEHPEFDFTGELTWYVPDPDQRWKLYEIDENDNLISTGAEYDREEGCFVLRTKTLGSYLLMNGAAKSAEAEISDGKDNPETGAAACAAALSALGMHIPGAVCV